LSNYSDLKSSLLPSVVILRAVPAEVSYFTAAEACLRIVASLALFLRQSILAPASWLAILALDFVSYNHVSFLVNANVAFVPLSVRNRGLVLVPLLRLFLKAVANSSGYPY